MAHNLEATDTMYSRALRPWHWMETQDRVNVLDDPPKDIKELLSAKYTNTNWQVNQQPVFTLSTEALARLESGEEITELPMDDIIQLEDNWANVRDRDGQILGLVGDRMVPLQNEQAAEFVWALVNTDQARFETGGSLKDGQIVWYMVELLEKPKLPGGEDVDSYVSIVNYHNGKGSLVAMNHDIRIVCNNTLDAALYGAKAQWTIRHTRSMNERVEEARVALGLAQEANEKLAKVANSLVTRAFTKDDFVDVLGTLYPIPPDSTALAQRRLTERQDEVLACWRNSPNLDNIRKTAWGAWNAVVEVVDHGQNYRSDESRMLSLMTPTGRSHQFKQLALNAIAQKADVDLAAV